MRFHAQHRFHGGPDAVFKVLSDPSFYMDLEIPDLSRPEVLEHTSTGDEVGLRLRYEYVGDLDPIVHRFLGHQRLTWIQEVRIDRRAASGTIGYEAEKTPRLLHGDASFVLEPDGDETVRRLDGELVVHVAGIGGMAEHRIVPGLIRRLDIEAQAVNDRLGSPG
jgi:Protein of unknown function (DUF2505)